jgi:predicted membrane protein (TIGR00267 family)
MLNYLNRAFVLQNMPLRIKDHERAEAIGSRVFGSMDGVISTLAVVAGVVGATTNHTIVLVAGVAAMMAEAISMGFSSYSSARVREKILGHKKALVKRTAREGTEFWLVTMGGGAIPLVPFLLRLTDTITSLKIAVILSAVFLFSIGFYVGKLTKKDALYEGLFNVSMGMIAAAATYAVGYGISLLQI